MAERLIALIFPFLFNASFLNYRLNRWNSLSPCRRDDDTTAQKNNNNKTSANSSNMLKVKQWYDKFDGWQKPAISRTPNLFPAAPQPRRQTFHAIVCRWHQKGTNCWFWEAEIQQSSQQTSYYFFSFFCRLLCDCFLQRETEILMSPASCCCSVSFVALKFWFVVPLGEQPNESDFRI